MGDALSLLRKAKENADTSSIDRHNYAAYIADRVGNGGWSDDDTLEYRDAVRAIMAGNNEDEKKSASEFWALKANGMGASVGITERIQLSIKNDRRVQA